MNHIWFFFRFYEIIQLYDNVRWSSSTLSDLYDVTFGFNLYSIILALEFISCSISFRYCVKAKNRCIRVVWRNTICFWKQLNSSTNQLSKSSSNCLLTWETFLFCTIFPNIHIDLPLSSCRKKILMSSLVNLGKDCFTVEKTRC